MKRYKVQITEVALADLEEIYNYILEEFQSPETAMGQYDRIADAIETLEKMPERIKLLESEEEKSLGLRQLLIDNYSIFFFIRNQLVIITNILYSASDLTKRLLE